MRKTMMPRLFLPSLLLALPTMILAQPNENRGSMTLNEAGQVLRFVAEEDDEPTAVLESGASSTEILAFNDPLQGEDVWGFGNIADLNDAGVAVMKVVTCTYDDGDDSCEEDLRGANDNELNQFLVTSDNGGTPNVIAVATRTGAGSTVFGDSVLCNIGPMPENNNAGQVAWFGALTLSADPSDDCEDVDDFYSGLNTFAFNESFIDNECCDDYYFDPDQDETTLSPNDAVTGTYYTGFSVGNESSAIFRYTPGSGHEVLLEGSASGDKDELMVSDSRFVPSPTMFEVAEVDFIRDGSQRFNAAGDIIAHAQVITAGDLPPASYSGCTANVNSTQNNPNDDPADDMPYIRFRDISCPGAGSNSLELEDALVLFRGSTKTVVALTGPDSVYSEVEDEGAVINAGGQVLFRAEEQGDDRGSGLAVLELYTPGSGWQTIAREGDPLPTPGSDHFFCDFSPHYDLADDGSLAFQAEIGDCEIEERGLDGETAIFRYADGVITELFRTSDREEVGVDVPSTWQGNPIGELSSVAISPTSGLVQFYVESDDPDAEPSDCQEMTRGNFSTNFGGGEWTALVSWTELNGLETVMAEGDPIGAGDAYIFRIYAMGPKLRAQANSSAEMVALVDINRDGMGCDVDQDDEDIDETQVVLIGRGTPPIGSILEIPVAGPLGLGIFAAALLMLSMMWVRHRAPGV